MNRILCVEDADDTIDILASSLSEHHLTFARSVKEASQFLKKEAFSLVLLDISLPDGTGFEILAEQQEKSTPFFFLTGKTDFSSKVSAFALGADDFIQKPFNPKELKLRVDSKLRKAAVAMEHQSVLRIGDLICSAQEQRIRRQSDNVAVELTSHEFRIFSLLARTPEKIFTREEILDRIWTNAVAVTDRTIDVHVSNLRQKLKGTRVSIDTVIGVGYRISASK